MKRITRSLLTLTALALLVGTAAAEPAGDRVSVGFDPEPGDATFGYVPAAIPPGEVIAVFVDRTGPLTSGVVLLTGGRSVEFSSVESRPFAVTEAFEPPMVAFAEK